MIRSRLGSISKKVGVLLGDAREKWMTSRAMRVPTPAELIQA